MPVPHITALPPPPQVGLQNEEEFDQTADAFLIALPSFVEETNDVADWINSQLEAVEAAKNAGAASASAAAASAVAAQQAQVAAAASAGAAAWAAGQSIQAGAVRYSPVSGALFRATVAHTAQTDPANDPAHWQPLNTGLPVVVATTTSILAQAGFIYHLCGDEKQTMTLPAAPAQGARVGVIVGNSRIDNEILGFIESEPLILNMKNAAGTLVFSNGEWIKEEN